MSRMETIRFGQSSRTKPVFLTLINSDLTEGRGHSVVHSVHLSEDAAEAAAYGSDTMGTDGTTVSVRTGAGVAGQPIFARDSADTLFGYAAAVCKNYNGPRYTRLADIPNFNDEQWKEFARLSRAAGRNPLVEGDQQRRERIRARKDALLSVGRSSHPLYAVVMDDSRRGAGLSSEPLIVAVLDTETPEEAANVFVAALNQHPSLSTHRVVELFPGRSGKEMFGKVIDLPKSKEMTARLLGANADGTVFIIPGETEEYVLRGGTLYTSDGYEADLVGLAGQGLRVRTDSDVAAIAYQKMQNMLVKASRG